MQVVLSEGKHAPIDERGKTSNQLQVQIKTWQPVPSTGKHVRQEMRLCRHDQETCCAIKSCSWKQKCVSEGKRVPRQRSRARIPTKPLTMVLK